MDSPNVRCYEAIVNRAITLLVKGSEVDEMELALGTDSDLLRMLSSSKEPMVREFYYRLLRRQPYCYLGSAMVPANTTRTDVETAVAVIVRDAKLGEHDLLCHVPFRREPKKSSPWLRIHAIDGMPIEKKYPWFTQALFETEEQLKRTIRFYAKSNDKQKGIAELIGDHFKTFERA